MRSVQTDGSVHVQRDVASPACVASGGTVASLFSIVGDFIASIFLRPFARRALPRFNALMDALTPGRVGSSGRYSGPLNADSGCVQVSLFHVSDLPIIPSPTT